MLTASFREEIAGAEPGVRITAVMSFAVDMSRGGASLLERIAAAKQPVLDAVMSMRDVEVTPLPNLPNAIATATAAEWRALIDRDLWLAESESVRFDPNVVVARELRAPALLAATAPSPVASPAAGAGLRRRLGSPS